MCYGLFIVMDAVRSCPQTLHFYLERLATPRLLERSQPVFVINRSTYICSFNKSPLGHVNKINCFSSFCLQKFGEGGGYLLFIFRGQRSYATIFTGVNLGYKRRVKGKTGTTQVKKE